MPDETANHGYSRPSKGTEDWHVPLNENFRRIDTAIEIRAPESDIGEYESKKGAKFLATDTGAVYVGDGDQWQAIGQLTSRQRTIDGASIARPADLQSVIDGASTDVEFAQVPTQTIRLQSGKTYELDETIRVKPNVRLECNGARIVPTGDFNIFELHRGTQLIAPFCDTRDVNWSSTAVVIGPSDTGKIGVPNRAWVESAYLMGSKGEGIGIQFRGDENPCSMQHATGSLRGFDRAVDFYAAGEDTSGHGSWANGNHFSGRIWNYRIGISMRSDGAAVSGNFVRVQAQPNDEISEWLWHMDADPRDNAETRDDEKFIMRGNNVMAYPWDNQNYQQHNPLYESGDRRAPVWYLGRGTRYANSLWDLSGTLSNQYIVNNSDTAARNGVFTAHGGFVTGTDKFKAQPVYESNSRTRWHYASEND